MKKLKLALIMSCLLPNTVFAQYDSHWQAARDYLVASRAEALHEETLSLLVPGTQKILDLEDLDDEQRVVAEKYSAMLIELIDQELRWERVEPLIIEKYVEEFSEYELRELTEFYLSPSGQWLLGKTPKILKINDELDIEVRSTYHDKVLQLRNEMISELTLLQQTR